MAAAAAGFDELVPGVEQRGEHRESLLFNGLRLEMTVSRISTPFDELVRHLSVQLKPEELIRSGGTLRVSRPLGGGRMERYLLIDSGPGKPVTAFRVVTPEKLPKPPRWPSGLPRLPVGAEPVQVIEFCRTGNLYVSFRAASGEPAELLRSTAAGCGRQAGFPRGERPRRRSAAGEISSSTPRTAGSPGSTSPPAESVLFMSELTESGLKSGRSGAILRKNVPEWRNGRRT